MGVLQVDVIFRDLITAACTIVCLCIVRRWALMGCFPGMEQWNDCLSGKRTTIRLRTF